MPIPVPRDLPVRRKAISLAGRVYAATTSSPQYGEQRPLFQQMQQSVLSLATHITDGATRGTRVEFLRSLDSARRALAELEAQVCVGVELGLIATDSGLQRDIAEVRCLLNSVVLRLREFRERAASFVLPAQHTAMEVRSAPPAS